MKKTRTRGKVRNASRAHFSTNCGGTMARAVKGFRSLCTWTAPSEMSVLPVPHSAMTAAPRASFHRFTTPMIASVCAGNGLPEKLSRRAATLHRQSRAGAGTSEESVHRVRRPTHADMQPIESMSFGNGIVFSSWFVQSMQKSGRSEDFRQMWMSRRSASKATLWLRAGLRSWSVTSRKPRRSAQEFG